MELRGLGVPGRQAEGARALREGQAARDRDEAPSWPEVAQVQPAGQARPPGEAPLTGQAHLAGWGPEAGEAHGPGQLQDGGQTMPGLWPAQPAAERGGGADGSYWWPEEAPAWGGGVDAGGDAGRPGAGALWGAWPQGAGYGTAPGGPQGRTGQHWYGGTLHSPGGRYRSRAGQPASVAPPPASPWQHAGTGQGGPRGGRYSGGRQESKLRRAWRRFIGALAAIGAFLAKFGAILIKLKYVGLVLSMFVSVLAYTLFFGWSFAIGFVALIFVHEMGHVIVLRRQGVPASAPLFVPFLGAFVNMRQMPKNAYQEAVSGLAGPYFGTAASLAVSLWGHAVGSNFLLQLGAVGFLLNLFNLLPVLPLDGGRAAAALHPVLWLAGLLGLLAWEYFNPSPVALIILVLGGFELYRRWTRRNSPAAVAYHSLKARQRVAVALMYLLVVAVAVVGFQLTYVARGL